MARLESQDISVGGFSIKRLGFNAFDLYTHYFRSATHEDLTYYGSFPLMMYKRFGFKVMDGYLFVFRYLRSRAGERMDSVGLPINERGERLDVETTRECLESFNGKPGGRIIHLHPALSARYPSMLQSWKARAIGAEYIYGNDQIASLHGSTFKSLRRKVRRFSKNNSVEVVPYEKRFRAKADQLYAKWRQSEGSKYGRIWDERLFRNILDHHGTMDHQLNMVIEKRGGTFIGLFDAVRISPHLAIGVSLKLDTSYTNIAQYCVWYRAKQLSAMGCAFLNAGDDAGKPGLKEFKSSFQPISTYTPLLYKL